jgi:hypothetical protein
MPKGVPVGQKTKYSKSRPSPLPPPVIGAKWVPLTRGLFALVDDTDFEAVNRWNWSVKYGKRGNYAYRCDIALGSVGMSRFILGVCDASLFVDHINHNTLDNRRINLRICTQANNNKNVKKHNLDTTSKYKGVYFESSSGKWKAQIGFNGSRKTLGRFVTEEEAAAAYNLAAAKLFGQFALEAIWS